MAGCAKSLLFVVCFLAAFLLVLFRLLSKKCDFVTTVVSDTKKRKEYMARYEADSYLSKVEPS